MTDPAPLGPNQRQTSATTPGISRNMNPLDLAPATLGGGDLNGTAAVIFLGHGGTAASRWAVPRRAGGFSGNYCGVV